MKGPARIPYFPPSLPPWRGPLARMYVCSDPAIPFFSFRLMHPAHPPASLRMRTLRACKNQALPQRVQPRLLYRLRLAISRVFGCSTGYYRCSCLRVKNYRPFLDSYYRPMERENGYQFLARRYENDAVLYRFQGLTGVHFSGSSLFRRGNFFLSFFSPFGFLHGMMRWGSFVFTQ